MYVVSLSIVSTRVEISFSATLSCASSRFLFCSAFLSRFVSFRSCRSASRRRVWISLLAATKVEESLRFGLRKLLYNYRGRNIAHGATGGPSVSIRSRCGSPAHLRDGRNPPPSFHWTYIAYRRGVRSGVRNCDGACHCPTVRRLNSTRNIEDRS